MKLRTALAGAVGSGAGLAVANRVLAGRARDFDPLLRGDRGTYRWRGFDLAYTEAGDPADPDLLLLHGIGIAAAGHEWAGVFDRLARDYHVVAPDLPGFGHSDRPPLLYSASTYETAVADAVADLFADPPVVVASSLTGAYAAAAAREGSVGELVLVTPRAETTWARSVARRTLLRTPLVGQALFNVLASKPAIRHVHTPRRYADPARLTDRPPARRAIRAGIALRRLSRLVRRPRGGPRCPGRARHPRLGARGDRPAAVDRSRPGRTGGRPPRRLRRRPPAPARRTPRGVRRPAV